MTPENVTLIVTIVCVAIALIGFLRGFFKGVAKSGLDVLFTLVGTGLSVAITTASMSLVGTPEIVNSLIEALKQQLGSENVLKYLTMAQEYITSNENAQDLVNLVVAIPAILLTPLIFIFVYFTVGLILKIPRFIVEWLLLPKAKGLVSRLTGGAVGALRYLVAFVVLLMPIVGYLNCATAVIDAYSEATTQQTPAVVENVEGEEVQPLDIRETTAMKYVYGIRDSALAKTIYDLGGKAFFNSLTTTYVDGVELSLERETIGAIELYGLSAPLIKSPLEYTDEQIDALNEINASLENSEFLPLLLAKAVSFATGELYENGEIAGFEIPSLGDSFDPTVKRVLEILSETDSNELRNDLKTITNIAGHAIENGVLEELTKEEKDIMSLVMNDKLLTGVLTELYSNERTRNSIPYISNALNNYVCRIYNDINGTSIQPEEFDVTKYNIEGLEKEGAIIKNVITEMMEFMGSIEGRENVQDLVVNADLESLGESMEYARDSIIVGRSYKILFYAFLHSESCDDLGIIDKQFIDNATAENANLSEMLVSRQTLMKLVLSLQSVGTDGARQEMLHSVLESMLTDDAESVKELIDRNNLISMGIPYKSADTISQVVGSMLNTFEDFEFEDEEEKQEELLKTETVINAISSATTNKDLDNVFKVNGREESRTAMTAQEFVDSVTTSQIASEMLQHATGDDENEDPFFVQEHLSERDVTQITNAINNSYNSTEASEEQKQTLEALAKVFGITITK